jgi:hypothetical protein
MGTLNAFYVRSGADHVAVTRAIRTDFPDAEIERSTEFCGVQYPTTHLSLLNESLWIYHCG